MPNHVKSTDSIRMGVLGALLKKKSVQPNIRQVQRHTGYHMATIKGSLAFLEGQGVLQGFGPKIDSKKLSYSLEVLTLLQVDLSHQKAFEKFLEALQSDPHTYWASSIIGSGNWNILCRHIYRDVESYHRDLQKRYMRIPGYHDLIKNMQSFFSVEPVFKNKSRTECIIELVKEGNPKRD